MDGLIGWVGYRTTPIDGVFVAFCVRACLLAASIGADL